jgi:serine protease Do
MNQERPVWRMLRERRTLSSLAILVTLSIGILIGTLISRGVRAAQQSKGTDAAQIEIPAPQQLSTIFSKISKEVAPAVVNINTESSVRPTSGRRQPRGGDQGQGQDQGPQSSDPFDLFQRFFDQGPFSADPPDMKQRSLGSGMVVDPKGYILTNNHVVTRADRIRVKIQDDPKQYDAKLVGADSETDIAIIKIEADHPLKSVKIGNSDGLSVGDWVLAIGSPFGLEETVTAGIVSAKGRDIDSTRQFQRFIQTDAAINPGNSGGPLLNMAGEVIGINTAIATGTGSYAGVGFALPSNVASRVYNQLSRSGKVTRGSIGVSFQDDPEQNPIVLRSLGADHGVVILSIQPDGPSAKAGLKQGDVILSMDGEPIKSGDELVAKVADTPVGQAVTVKYMRDKKEQITKVVIEDRAKVFADRLGSNENESSNQPEGTDVKFGISIQNITPDVAGRLGITENKGVLVTSVDADSFAEDVGLLRGDVIVQVNHEAVNKVDDVLRIQKGLKSGADVVFLVQRTVQGQTSSQYLAGTLP